MKKSFCLFFTLVVLLSLKGFSQSETFVNRKFQASSGSPVFNPIFNPFGIQWSQSIRGNGGEIITVGHTNVSGQGEDILLTKLDPDGNVIFSVSWNSTSTQNDYGVNVYQAASGDIFVCGTTDNGGVTNYDAVILRYNSSGTLLNSATYSGVAGKNDFASALTIHPITNNLLIAISNENTGTGYDFLVLQLDPSSLATIGTPSTYDYASLSEVPLGIEIDFATGNILLIGGSQSSISTCAYAVAIFDGSTLAYISDIRTDLVGSPNDQAIAYIKDPNNNIYITGKTWAGSNFNIKTVKIASNYSIAWTSTLDVYGMDDVGNSIALDPTNGNVIIGGLCTRSSNRTDMISVRYNGSNGASISTFKQASENTSGNAAIKKICTSVSGNVYFVAGEKGSSGKLQVLVGKLNPLATKGWQRRIINLSQDILPSDIEITNDGIFAISVLDSLTDKYLTTGFEELTLDTAKKYISGKPVYMANELLIDFMPNAINKAAIDNQVGTKISEFGNLSDFLTTGANNAVNNAFETACKDCHFKAVRVHSDLKTTDTIGISRLGQNVPLPPVWSILLVQIPNTITLQKAKQIFSSLKNYISYVQYDNLMECTTPNDSLYSSQANLHSVNPNTNANINVEDAWNVVTGCGAPFVKGGVFDTGIMWRHKDFGYTGTTTSGKIEGWCFGAGFGSNSSTTGGVDIRTTFFGLSDFQLDPYVNGGHGTRVAGIIGAKRNNTSGISGIAGGDDSTGNPGVSLYSLNIQTLNRMFWVLKSYHAAHGGPTASNLPYNYGVDFSNHSYKMVPGWWPIDSFPLYRDEVHFANRMQVTFVASRGNDSTNNFVAPANYDSCWVISVGASNANGTKWSGSNYGSRMDVIAPGTYNIVNSTANNRSYAQFAGTSAAAPHVSGVVALLMSYMNNPTNPNDYMNLAPEDCDYIIQRSATDVGPSGYDSLNGYGRLNAGAALRMVEKPVRILYHFGTNSWTPHTISKSVYSNYDTIKLTEKYTTIDGVKTYNPGKYLVKIFEIQSTISHPGLYATDSVMHHWARHSSSSLFDLPTAQKKLDLHQRTKFASFSSSNATVKGYLYQVKDSTGINSLGWWPCDTTFNLLNVYGQHIFEYSVLSKNKAVGINEYQKSNDNINLFPNPSNERQTLTIRSEKESECKIELYDMMGRYIRNVYNGKISSGTNTVIHNVGGLSNSMYIYLINIDGKITSKKFIKE